MSQTTVGYDFSDMRREGVASAGYDRLVDQLYAWIKSDEVDKDWIRLSSLLVIAYTRLDQSYVLAVSHLVPRDVSLYERAGVRLAIFDAVHRLEGQMKPLFDDLGDTQVLSDDGRHHVCRIKWRVGTLMQKPVDLGDVRRIPTPWA